MITFTGKATGVVGTARIVITVIGLGGAFIGVYAFADPSRVTVQIQAPLKGIIIVIIAGIANTLGRITAIMGGIFGTRCCGAFAHPSAGAGVPIDVTSIKIIAGAHAVTVGGRKIGAVDFITSAVSIGR